MTAFRSLSDDERLDWLCLWRSEHVGPIAFRQLLARFGGAGAALDALPDLARRGGRRMTLAPFPRAAAERELERLTELGASLVAMAEPDYPPALAAVEDAPPLIAVLGDRKLLSRRAVAVVGARNASANGRRLASDLARDLGAAGFLIVSGLARGIDGAAHQGALATGTAAVMPGGIDVVYPPEHEELYRAIVGRGVVVAELPPGTQPAARLFPRRNRIVAGLSVGVLVVEAARRSGSLITARFGLEQGREVMAVPGSPLDPRCQGANHLIRQGAALIETAADVLEALESARPVSVTEPSAAFAGADGEPAEVSAEGRRQIEELLSPSPVAVDELVRQCQLSAPAVRTVLLELELAGRLERQPGNRVALLAPPAGL